MTLEVYINGSLSYRIANWIPDHDGDDTRDGRLISGEWLETIVSASGFARSGNHWESFYEISVSIPTALRLDMSYTEIDFISNPWNIPQPTHPWFRWNGPDFGIGPATERVYALHGIALNIPHDCDGYDSEGSCWRLRLKLYLTRITHKILRDPDTNNIILRNKEGSAGRILHDA